MRRLASYLSLMLEYFKLNLKAQLEYRGAFISQVAAMFLNDGVWVIFWVLFFSRFHVLRGWDIKDVITVWAVAAGGFGLGHALCGNALSLPGIIARGQLDVWMLYPRALLPHVILGRMSPTALGDALFGIFVYVAFVRPDLPHFILFCALVCSVSILFLGFSVITGSLTFFLGNAEGLAEQWRYAMITFSTYSATLFEGAVKIILYTAIPAAFVSYLPIVALKRFSLIDASLVLGGSLAFLFLGFAIFYWGLKQYESGNLMEMRG